MALTQCLTTLRQFYDNLIYTFFSLFGLWLASVIYHSRIDVNTKECEEREKCNLNYRKTIVDCRSLCESHKKTPVERLPDAYMENQRI